MNERLIPEHPIIIVDDEEQILLSIDTILRMAGLNNILPCKDSRQVMDLLARSFGNRPRREPYVAAVVRDADVVKQEFRYRTVERELKCASL